MFLNASSVATTGKLESALFPSTFITDHLFLLLCGMKDQEVFLSLSLCRVLLDPVWSCSSEASMVLPDVHSFPITFAVRLFLNPAASCSGWVSPPAGTAPLPWFCFIGYCGRGCVHVLKRLVMLGEPR